MKSLWDSGRNPYFCRPSPIPTPLTPPDPNAIYVFFNNDTQPIPRDETHQNGWDYDPGRNQVNFYGPACDQLRSGQVDKVDIKMGCAPPD